MLNDRLIVTKDSGRFAFLLLGLFQIGCSLLILYNLIINIINGDIFSQNVWLTLFLLFLMTFSLPAGIFALSYAFGERKLFEIDTNGIKFNNQNFIEWNNIFEIEIKKYRGPRMSFYRIKITHNYDRMKNKKIWFSSDTKPELNEIIDCLVYYTASNNISFTY